jgi:hypothetical protein
MLSRLTEYFFAMESRDAPVSLVDSIRARCSCRQIVQAGPVRFRGRRGKVHLQGLDRLDWIDCQAIALGIGP